MSYFVFSSNLIFALGTNATRNIKIEELRKAAKENKENSIYTY